MRIYWIRAQAPRRVLALAKHLGLDAEFIQIDLSAEGMTTAAYTALNPNRKAPTLVDGELVLWESSAIMAHLAIKAGSDMWPSGDPGGQVEMLKWLSWCDHHWSPAVAGFYFEHIVKATFGIGPPDIENREQHRPDLLRWSAVLNDHLAGRSWVALGRLTIADFQLASMACDWREAQMPFNAFPHIVGWLDRLDALPAWKDPWPT